MGESTFAEIGTDSGGQPASPDARGASALAARACVLVPAFDAEESIAEVIAGLRRAIPELASAIVVIDDGSRDATATVARDAGCTVIPSARGAEHEGGAAAFSNRGKGAALRAGFEHAREQGKTVALTVDADGQHLPDEARRVLFASPDEQALVLGVRDLVRDGAPRANRFSNKLSNLFLSGFTRRPLHDTQCGLRRYPVRDTLRLASRGEGYDFEAEVILRAIWSGIPIVEEPIRVLYPEVRKTHFRSGRDVQRIVRTVVATVGERLLRPSAFAEER